MDFTKFVSVLEDQALYFSKITRLEDPFEGFLTRATVNRLSSIPDGLSSKDRKKRQQIVDHNLCLFRKAREILFVSSWHLNPGESAAMWRVYLKSDEGIAIQSTVGRLEKCFAIAKEEVFIGEVSYVDYDKDQIPWGNMLYWALHKRKSFEYEKELRAIVISADDMSSDLPGKYIHADLDTLIEWIYLAPNSPPWIHKLVKKTLNRYRLNKKVVHSGLEQNPIY